MACETFHDKKCFNTGKSWKPILYLNAFKCIHKTVQETLASSFSSSSFLFPTYTQFHALGKENP